MTMKEPYRTGVDVRQQELASRVRPKGQPAQQCKSGRTKLSGRAQAGLRRQRRADRWEPTQSIPLDARTGLDEVLIANLIARAQFATTSASPGTGEMRASAF